MTQIIQNPIAFGPTTFQLATGFNISNTANKKEVH